MASSRRSVLRSTAGLGGLTVGAMLATGTGPAAAATYSGQTGWINVRTDFGAKGDGTTDDTAAIQGALAAVPVGGVVYFPNGVYEISSPLTVSVTGTKLIGDKASTGYSAGGANQTVIDAKSGFSGAAMIQVAGIADFAIRDLDIHGTNTTGSTIGLNLTASGSCMLENLLVARTAGDGIYLSDINPVVMRQVGVYHAGVTSGTGYGINIQGISDSWYTNVLTAGCQTAGWNIEGGDNSTFTACRAEDGPASAYGFYFHDTELRGGTSFVQCTTDSNDGEGFYLENLSGNGPIQLDACYFRRDGNQDSAGSTTLAGVHVSGCTIPVLLSDTSVIARQADSDSGQDSPHWGLAVDTSTYVSVAGGYYSCDSAGEPFHWDGKGAFQLSPNIPTATVDASSPTLNTSRPSGPNPGPRDQNLLAWTYDPIMQSSSSALTAGTVYMIRVQVFEPCWVSDIVLEVVDAGQSLVASENFAGLYSASGAQIAVTADQSSTWASVGGKSMPLAGGPFYVQAGYVYVAVVSNATGTLPSIGRCTVQGAASINAGLSAATSRYATGPTGQKTLPATITMSSLSPLANSFWAALS
jgi:hypothetical protein